MFRKLFEKIGIIKKPRWWERVSNPYILVGILFVVGILFFIAGFQLHSSGGDVDFGIKKEKSVYRNAELEKEYRKIVGPFLVNYFDARVLYQDRADRISYLKWLKLTHETKDFLLGQIVPAYYKDFHLRSVVALTFEESGLADLLGEPIDTGGVLSTLEKRGEEKLKTADKKWAAALKGQEWLDK